MNTQGWSPPDPLPPVWGENKNYLKKEDVRPWWKKKRFNIPILAVIGLVIIGVLVEDPAPTRTHFPSQSSQPVASTTPAVEPKTAVSDRTVTTQTIATPESKPLPSHRNVSARQWDQIYKNPDTHVGERIIVYGEIHQFDSATGDEGFLANVDGVRRMEYGVALYEDNVAMRGDASKLNDFVEKDLFMARVTIDGSYSYDTQIGGNTSVPMLEIDSIKRTGTSE